MKFSLFSKKKVAMTAAVDAYGRKMLEEALHAVTNPPCPTFTVVYHSSEEGGCTTLLLRPNFGSYMSLGMEMMRRNPAWTGDWYWCNSYGNHTNVLVLSNFKGNYPKLAVAAIQSLITIHLDELVELDRNLAIIKSSRATNEQKQS
jgi:hypothetical protein